MNWLCRLDLHKWRFADSDTYWISQRCARCGAVREWRCVD